LVLKQVEKGFFSTKLQSIIQTGGGVFLCGSIGSVSGRSLCGSFRYWFSGMQHIGTDNRRGRVPVWIDRITGGDYFSGLLVAAWLFPLFRRFDCSHW
jgi:hypothetical protein